MILSVTIADGSQQKPPTSKLIQKVGRSVHLQVLNIRGLDKHLKSWHSCCALSEAWSPFWKGSLHEGLLSGLVARNDVLPARITLASCEKNRVFRRNIITEVM